MTKRRGVLIALEGIDGAGKTTQADRLERELTRLGERVVRTKEPTDGTYGRELRQSATAGRLSPDRELELFLLDRQQHVRELLQPSLDDGAVVLVDRYYFSTVAYQGARGMSPAELLAKNEAFAPRPDLVVLLDVEPEVGLSRIRQRGDIANAFEQESSLREVGKVFRSLQLPYLLKVDGRQAPEDITRTILDALFQGPLAQRPRPALSGSGT